MKIPYKIPDIHPDPVEEARRAFSGLQGVRSATVYAATGSRPGWDLVVDLYHRSGKDTPEFKTLEEQVLKGLKGRRETRLPGKAQTKRPSVPRKYKW